MKKFTMVLMLLCCGLFATGGIATAALTEILPGPEVPLTGYGGVLDQIYGWDNLTRVDDNSDQIWNPASGKATAQAKYAYFTEDFGYIPDLNGDNIYNEDFEYLFTVTGNGLNFGAPVAYLGSGDVSFVWALDPSGSSSVWTSLPGQNDDFIDHMVTFRINEVADDVTALQDNGRYPKYVIAWEDLRGGGDRDYNDLVVEVNVAPVPIPSAILLLGSGLVAMIGIRRRFIS